MKKILLSLWTVVLCWVALATPARSTTIPVAWGGNSYGTLGDGTTKDSSIPVVVVTSGVLAGKTIKAVSSGPGHSLALTSEGRVYAWGVNEFGTLGDNTYTNSNIPVAVNTSGVLRDKTIIDISTSEFQSWALSSDGKIYGWGLVIPGGGNSLGSSAVPYALDMSGIPSGKTIISISSGDSHNLALSSDGRIYGWSHGSSEIGDGTTIHRPTPTAIDMSGVLAGKFITAVSAGDFHSLALDSQGRVYAWGANYAGELGDGTFMDRSSPVAVDASGALAGKKIVDISAGSHSLALSSDSSLFAWGANHQGQLGNGTKISSNVPVAVNTSGSIDGQTIDSISAGGYRSLALTSAGFVYGWGDNRDGALGDGTTISRSTPVAVDVSGILAGRIVTAISSGGNSLALALEPITVTVTQPTLGAGTRALNLITGTASTNIAGLSVSRVDAYLRRRNNSETIEYWGLRNGTWGWNTPVAALPTVLSSGGWSVKANAPAGTVLPSGSTLPDGTYYAHAIAYDNAGNRKVSAVNSFKVDRMVPSSLTVSHPLHGSAVRSLASVTGTATDNINGSGIASVTFTFKRISDSQFWNGTGWAATATALTTTLNQTTWARNSDLPAGTNLLDGSYTISAVARDKAGNGKGAGATFRVDRVVPTSVVVTGPTNGSTSRSIASITGTSADNTGGSGIAKVNAYLRRKNSSGVLEYWANRAGTWEWGASVTSIPTTLTSSGSWSVSNTSPVGTLLPAGSNLPSGTYQVFAYAYDRAGNY